MNTDTLCQLLQDSDAEVRGVCERALRVRGLSSAQVSLAKRMHPALRSFYQLEGLWGDAPQTRLPSESQEAR